MSLHTHFVNSIPFFPITISQQYSSESCFSESELNLVSKSHSVPSATIQISLYNPDFSDKFVNLKISAPLLYNMLMATKKH